MVQAQYWKELYQLKTHISFIELQLKKAESIDRGLKIVLGLQISKQLLGRRVCLNGIEKLS